MGSAKKNNFYDLLIIYCMSYFIVKDKYRIFSNSLNVRFFCFVKLISLDFRLLGDKTSKRALGNCAHHNPFLQSKTKRYSVYSHKRQRKSNKSSNLKSWNQWCRQKLYFGWATTKVYGPYFPTRERISKKRYERTNRQTEKTATFCIIKAITAKHCLYKIL